MAKLEPRSVSLSLSLSLSFPLVLRTSLQKGYVMKEQNKKKQTKNTNKQTKATSKKNHARMTTQKKHF